jgi:DNA-binding CsgD family transcriptional regulator
MKANAGSYKSFLNSVLNSAGSLLKDDAATVIEHFLPVRQIPFRYAPTSFLLDYSTKRYLYVDDSCYGLLGYKASYFLETGLEEYLSKWHPDDFYVIDTTVFPDNIHFLKSVRSHEYNDYIFTYNYRMLNAKGEYVTVLQRFSYIPGTHHSPAGVIGVIFDITHYKNDTSIIHTIEKASVVNNSIVNELVYKKTHAVLGCRGKILSKKEREILKFIAQGLASKQIADRISASINTINNHRRNMLAKTGCRSSSELINYAMRAGLL